jgi:lysine-N-methylase
MRVIVPDYYKEFSCIAGACRHSCCIGWEIDIDEETMETYRALPDPLGARLRENIVPGDPPHFRLGAGERCPFLNKEGLCDLIIGLGEDCLCQICADHPRFRNFLSDRTEIGLGLCCEAAAELILHRQEPMGFITLEDDGGDEEPDAAFLAFREKLLALAQNRALPVEQRVKNILAACGVAMEVDSSHWQRFLGQLERLDDVWLDVLARLSEPQQVVDSCWEIPLEQLLCYLLFRHLAGALEDGDVQGRVAYCCLMWYLLRQMLRNDLPEIARLYSSEIEYSDENMEAILEEINDILFA